MSKKLLVIDDEKSITIIVDKIASGLGYDVKTLTDPAAALATFKAFQPDVVMLDVVMPTIDGIDILRDILGAGTRAKIIVMTGFGPGYLRLARAVAEFDNHPFVAELAKPFRRVDVVALLGDDVPVTGASAGDSVGDRAAA